MQKDLEKEETFNRIRLTLNFDTQRIRNQSIHIPFITDDYEKEPPKTVEFIWKDFDDFDDTAVQIILESFDYMYKELRDELLEKLKRRLSNVNGEL